MKNTLFEELPDEWWREHWQDMPEFVQVENKPSQQIIVSFESFEDVKKFAELVGAKVTPKTKRMWYPFRKLKKNTQGYGI